MNYADAERALTYVEVRLAKRREAFNAIMGHLAHPDELSLVDAAALGAQAGEIESQMVDLRAIQRLLDGGF